MNKPRPLLLLALLSAFPPLSTDMYLPAIPLLEKTWNQPLSMVNLTLVCFFVCYCICLLFYGPVSDRFGRRRPLLSGIGLFIVASMMCAAAWNLGALIGFRVLQAAGAASASALALAISKDVYEGWERERVLAHIGVIVGIAPMLAPMLGGWIMTFSSWRWVFIIQGIIGAIAWIRVFKMPETLETFSSTGFLQTAGTYLGLFKNRRYIGFTFLLSFIVLPFFAFIGGSADIYITRLGLSEQAFGYFFGSNAMCFMAGAFACSRLLRKAGSTGLMTAGFAGIFLGSLAMLLHLFPGPWGLCVPMAVVSFSFGLSRPPSNNLILEQVDQNAGAASSFLIFLYFMLGAFSMWLISFDWADKIRVIGMMGTATSGPILFIWLLFSRKAAINPRPAAR